MTGDNSGLRMWIAAVGGLAVFAVLAILVRLGATGPLDRHLLIAIDGQPDSADTPLWLRETIIDLTALGGYPVLTVVVILATIGLALAGRHRFASLVAVNAVLGTLVVNAAKFAFSRARPDVVDHIDLTFTSSFPSGHASMSAVVWLTLAIVGADLAERRALSLFSLFAGAALTLLIGSSRLYLGVHWPSDVLAGWALGAALIATSLLVFRRIEKGGT